MQPARALALMEPIVSALAAAHRCRPDPPRHQARERPDRRRAVGRPGQGRRLRPGQGRQRRHPAHRHRRRDHRHRLLPRPRARRRRHQRRPRRRVRRRRGALRAAHRQKPHEGESPIAVAYKHVHEDVPPPSRLVPGIPAYVDALVARATARDRAQRPADAGVLLHQLHRVAQALAGGVWDDEELDHRPRASPPRRCTRGSPTRPTPSSCCPIAPPRARLAGAGRRRRGPGHRRSTALASAAEPPADAGSATAGRAGHAAARSCWSSPW